MNLEHRERRIKFFLGSLLLMEGFLFLHVLVQMWPAVELVSRATEETPAGTQTVSLFWNSVVWQISPDAVLVLLVIVVGSLDAFVHATTSISQYLGRGTFKTSWGWWYVLRPFIGAGLAILLYFAVRGGLLTVTSDSGSINPYGIAAFAGLAGLFSTPATKKLADIFGAALGDRPAEAVVPSITGLMPLEIPAGKGATSVTVSGTNFIPGSVVQVGNRDQSTSFVDTTQLKVELDANTVAVPAELDVVIRNPSGAESERARLKVV